MCLWEHPPKGEAGASKHPLCLGSLGRWQLCPHLDLVHVSPRESQRFISLGVRCPLRKSVASLESSGLRTDRASSGPPQLLMIWVTHKPHEEERTCNGQNVKPGTHRGARIKDKAGPWISSVTSRNINLTKSLKETGQFRGT